MSALLSCWKVHTETWHNLIVTANEMQEKGVALDGARDIGAQQHCAQELAHAGNAHHLHACRERCSPWLNFEAGRGMQLMTVYHVDTTVGTARWVQSILIKSESACYSTERHESTAKGNAKYEGRTAPRLSAREPSDVAKLLARSLAPMPKAAMKASTTETPKIQVYSSAQQAGSA